MKAITTKYHGPTDSRGSRIIASDQDKNRVTVAWDHTLQVESNHDAAAKALCQKMGWRGSFYRGSLSNSSNVYVWSTGVDQIIVALRKA